MELLHNNISVDVCLPAQDVTPAEDIEAAKKELAQTKAFCQAHIDWANERGWGKLLKEKV